MPVRGRSAASLCFFNDTATTEIYTLSLHDALPIWPRRLPLLIEPNRHLDLGLPPVAQHRHAHPLPDRCCATGGRPRSDRKSTRLNSSHLVISYAVFCLKKKTS